MGLFRRKIKTEKPWSAAPKESSRNKDSDPSNIQEPAPSAKSALGGVVEERKSRAKPWYGIPSQADPSGRTSPIQEPKKNDADKIQSYNPKYYNVNDDPRLKSIQSRINGIVSEISQAKRDMPDGPAYFTTALFGNDSDRIRNSLEEQRRDHAEARLQNLRAKKADLEMQYEREQENISIAHAAEDNQNRLEYYRKEIERVGGTPEQRKRLKRKLGIEYDEKENKISGEEDPIKALKLRFAKGEITKKQFLEMKNLLE